MRIIDFFDRAVRQFGERACLIDADTTLTYQQTQAESGRVANYLRTVGVAEGEKVGILAPNCAPAFAAILGVMRARCVWVPLNSRNSVNDIVQFLKMVDCTTLVYHADFKDLIPEFEAACPGLTNYVSLEDRRWEQEGERYTDRLDWNEDDVVSVFSTGGTTGAPKAAVWCHKTWQAMITNFLAGITYTHPPVHLIAAPMTHAAGVINIPLLVHGVTAVMLRKADPLQIMQAIEDYKVNTLFLPPTVIYTILAHPRVKEFDYSSLENFIYAAAPMSVEKLKEAMGIFGPTMVQTYGQAEAPMVCTIMTRHEHKRAIDEKNDRRLGSCGRPALLNNVGIMDDNGSLLRAGEVGEIVVRGPLVMEGYYNNPEATAESSAFGWHHTGDIGYVDEDGYFYITDRKRDMIITGGFNVYPGEIEQVIWGHPAIQECAVIGIPDDKWGEAVTAVIELKPGVAVSEQEIINHVKTRLGGVKAPKHVKIWDKLPRSPVGKVLKRSIREHFWSTQQRKI